MMKMTPNAQEEHSMTEQEEFEQLLRDVRDYFEGRYVPRFCDSKRPNGGNDAD